MAKILLKNVRIAFPTLFEPKSVGDGDPTFSASFILPADTSDSNVKTVTAAIIEVATEKWKDKAKANLTTLKATDKLCLHDGATKANYTGFEGKLYVSSSNKAKPVCVNRDKSGLTAADGKPYSGSYVNCTLDIWAMDNKFGKRVCATLLGVQFFADGEAFSNGAVGSADDFEELEPAGAGGAADFDLI